MTRLALVREQISSIEKTRAERLERAPDTGPHAMVRLLARGDRYRHRDGGHAGGGRSCRGSRSKSGGALRRAHGIARNTANISMHSDSQGPIRAEKC